MNIKRIERKIQNSTKNKDYKKALDIIEEQYKKLFRKMLKYKKMKIDKDLYLYDYIIKIEEKYNILFSKEISDMKYVLYSDKFTSKQQIIWLLDNFTEFCDYKV